MTKPATLLVSALAVVVYLGLVLAFHPFVADDAFIVGRYALNAAAGEGLVYNAGERVSALTSPLHGLILTGIAFLSSDPVAVWRIVAPFLPLLAVFAAFRIYAPAGAERLVVLALGLVSPFLALWGVGGLETPILAALLTLFAAVLMRGYREGALSSRDLMALGVLSGLGFLARHDSVLVTFPPLVAILAVSWRRAALWRAAAVAAVIAGSWLLFSLAYYGDLFPTSFYVKGPARTGLNLDSISATVNFLLVSGVLLALLVPLFGGRRRAERAAVTGISRAILWGSAAAALIFFAYAFYFSGVHMMFAYRMFVPVLPALAIWLAAGITGTRAALLVALQGAVHLWAVVTITTTGMNAAPVHDFGILGRTIPEMSDWTPRGYGLFMATLEDDGAVLVRDWAESGEPGRAPRIYLHTGGMGYWLPGFYIFEALVSYRHDCYPGTRRALLASDYVQDLGNRSSDGIRPIYFADRQGQDIRVLGEDVVAISKNWSWRIRVRRAEPLMEIELPDRIGGVCAGAWPDLPGEGRENLASARAPS